MDKFTKGILTVIAVGIVALNVQLMNGGGFITKAYAMDIQKVALCSEDGTICANIGQSGLEVIDLSAR